MTKPLNDLFDITDIEILNEVLTTIKTQWAKDMGWTKVMADPEIVDQVWLTENLKHEYECYSWYWYFENEEDAILFKLRWSDRG